MTSMRAMNDMITFTLNGQTVETDDSLDTPLLWVIRDTFGLTGSKFGCGMAQCGACTIHFNGHATRSCVLPIANVAGQEVTTIEGLGLSLIHISEPTRPY